MSRFARWPLAAALCLLLPFARAQDPGLSSDPQVRDPKLFDPNRPLAGEHALTPTGDFTLALVGDMIISRPLARAPHVTGFDELLNVIRQSDAAFGNLETTLLDIRHFSGAPVSVRWGLGQHRRTRRRGRSRHDGI